jgi:hypothetical protein
MCAAARGAVIVIVIVIVIDYFGSCDAPSLHHLDALKRAMH